VHQGGGQLVGSSRGQKEAASCTKRVAWLPAAWRSGGRLPAVLPAAAATTALTACEALLRVLDNQEVVRVGSTQAVKVPVRVLSACHESLPELVAAGDWAIEYAAERVKEQHGARSRTSMSEPTMQHAARATRNEHQLGVQISRRRPDDAVSRTQQDSAGADHADHAGGEEQGKERRERPHHPPVPPPGARTHGTRQLHITTRGPSRTSYPSSRPGGAS